MPLNVQLARVLVWMLRLLAYLYSLLADHCLELVAWYDAGSVTHRFTAYFTRRSLLKRLALEMEESALFLRE